MRWAKSTAASGSPHVDHEHGELVPAQPGHGVARPHDRGEQPAGPHQHAVADVVAQCVVDGLEPVQVAEAQGDGLARALGRGQRLLHPVVEEGPVGQTGELVVEGQVAQVGLEGLALAQRGLEGPGVHLDLVGLAGDGADEPHHPQVDEGEDGDADAGHDRHVDREPRASWPPAAGLGGRNPAKATTGIRWPPVVLPHVDVGRLRGGRRRRLGHGRVQGRRADQDGDQEEQGVHRVAGGVPAVEDQQVVGEVRHQQDAQGRGQQLVERLVARPNSSARRR